MIIERQHGAGVGCVVGVSGMSVKVVPNAKECSDLCGVTCFPSSALNIADTAVFLQKKKMQQ